MSSTKDIGIKKVVFLQYLPQYQNFASIVTLDAAGIEEDNVLLTITTFNFLLFVLFVLMTRIVQKSFSRPVL